MKKVFLASLFLLLNFACAKSCQKTKVDEAAADPKVSAALVNGKSVSLAKLEELHMRTQTQIKKSGQPLQPETERKIWAGILRKLVEDELISQKALQIGLKVDRIEREEALEKYKTRMGGPKGYEALLKQGTITEEAIDRKSIGGNLVYQTAWKNGC